MVLPVVQSFATAILSRVLVREPAGRWALAPILADIDALRCQCYVEAAKANPLFDFGDLQSLSRFILAADA